MRKIGLLVFVTLVLFSSVSIVEAARTIPASNDTSSLSVEISATAIGGLRARTDMTLVQGNEDLADNPPLNPAGEGVAVIGYHEHTLATSGAIQYDKDIYVDTGNQIDPANNLEVSRIIDFSASADGEMGGNMISTESVMVSVAAASAEADSSCCAWGMTDAETTLPATNDRIIAGSDVSLSEGQVVSESSARTIAASIEEPVEMTYSVEVGPSGQTDDEMAHGSAAAYVEADLMEGNGSGTNQTTDMGYDQSVSVRGLVDLAMSVSYSTA